MWTIVNGFDQTNVIPFDSIQLSSSINDPQPTASFDILDIGSQLSFAVGQEVIIHDENAPPAPLLGGGSVAATPAHNILRNSVAFNDSSNWTTSGALAGLVTLPNTFTVQVTFSNNVLGNAFITQTTKFGYIHAGQQYMLAGYVTNTSLVNAQSVLQIVWLDGSGNTISSISNTQTINLSNKHINVSGIAPAGAINAQINVGAQTTVAGTNSGTVAIGTIQFEPMYFATSQNVSYPTNDCNAAQTDCFTMPDSSVSRYSRLFAGYIDDYVIEYDGNNRVWHISCAGPGALLENGQVNAVYTAQFDDQIISSVVSTYFSGQLSVGTPNNTGTPSSVVRGVLIDAQSYNDNSLREVLNGLSDESGYMFYVDPYYRLNYNPAYYNAAAWTLTDGVADNITTFNYYDYSFESDGTQRKRRIKIIGGKFIAPAITDTFSGNGSNKTFSPLSQQPYNVTSVTVGGVAQKTGVKGRDTLGTNGIVALVDKANQQLIFQNAPASGTNNVAITYTYEAPVVTQVLDQDATNTPVAPIYAQPNYDAKVNDANITSITAATTRGLAELTKFSKPRSIIKLKCSQFVPAGTVIFVTHTLSGLTNAPYAVQQVDGSYLGNGINEYSYQLGAYQPSLTDHLRNANKAVNRSTTTANITVVQQTDLVFSESAQWSDTITFNLIAPNTGNYGSAHYGTNTYA